MNDTPRTDEWETYCDKGFEEWWNDHENGCPTLVLDNDEQFARAVWNAALADIGNSLRSELTAVTEQRDRLAEALRECCEASVELLGERDWWQDEPRCDYQKRYQETRDNVIMVKEISKDDAVIYRWIETHKLGYE